MILITLSLTEDDIRILDAYLNETIGIPLARKITEPFIQRVAQQIRDQQQKRIRDELIGSQGGVGGSSSNGGNCP